MVILKNGIPSVTETAGCLRTEVVWEGEAPAEPGACNRHFVRLAERLGPPKTPPKPSRTRWDTVYALLARFVSPWPLSRLAHVIAVVNSFPTLAA
jgi:hypothetical protein